MDMIRDGGTTVICPECFAQLHVGEPVVEGQEILCHQCRMVVVIQRVDGQLVPTVRKAPEAEEDTTW